MQRTIVNISKMRISDLLVGDVMNRDPDSKFSLPGRASGVANTTALCPGSVGRFSMNSSKVISE